MLSGARCVRADLPLSITLVEYATDLVFRSPAILQPLYQQLCRQAVLSVKAEHIATFLGHQITPNLVQEVGNQFSTRIEGTCIKHHYGKSTVKMYDKFALVLRLETTTNNVSFFKHHRKVEHRHGRSTRQLAPVKKSIYSLRDLRDILLGCNQRYLAYLATLDDFSAGVRALNRITRPNPAKGKSVKPVNFFSSIDRTCYAPSTDRPSTFPECAVPTSSLWSPNFLRRPCPDTSRVCVISGSLDASAEPTATTSPVSAAPQSQPAATSPKTFSFPLSHDKIFAKNVKNRFTRAYR